MGRRRSVGGVLWLVFCGLFGLSVTVPANLAVIGYQQPLSHNYLNSLVQTTDLVADLRGFVGTTVPSSDSGVTGTVVHVLGQSTVGDSGNGLFYWNATSTAADDGVNTIKPTSVSGAGRWLRTASPAPNLNGLTISPSSVTLSVTSGGNNSGNCVSAACATPAYAIEQAGNFLMLGQSLNIVLGPGNFACPGSISGQLTINLGNQISGTYVNFYGAGATSTFLQTPPGAFCVSLSDAGGVYFHDMSVDTGGGEVGIFCQNHSSCEVRNLAFVGTGVPFHAEGDGLIESPASTSLLANALTLNGNIENFWTGDHGGLFEFDPGSTSPTIYCGAGYTHTGNQFFAGTDDAVVFIGSGTTTSGCGSVTGYQFQMQQNAVIQNQAGMTIPGSSGAVERLLVQGARIDPATAPTVAGSNGIGNGTVAVTAGAGPYGGTVSITAGSTTASSGYVSLSFGEAVVMGSANNIPGRNCSYMNTATGSWNAAAIACQIGYTGVGGIELIWNNNGVALAAGDAFNIGYTQNGDN